VNLMTNRRLDALERQVRAESERDLPRRLGHRMFERVVADGVPETEAAASLISLGVDESHLPLPTCRGRATMRTPTMADHEALLRAHVNTAAWIPEYETVRVQIRSYARRAGIGIETETME
jgi:hypothetical protein